MATSTPKVASALLVLTALPMAVLAYRWWQLDPLQPPATVVKTQKLAQVELSTIKPIDPKALSVLPTKPSAQWPALTDELNPQETGDRALPSAETPSSATPSSATQGGVTTENKADDSAAEAIISPSSVALAPQVSEEHQGQIVRSQSTQIGQTDRQSDLSLDEIDLSSLPDDLAYQVQAALSENSQAPQSDSDATAQDNGSVSQLEIERSQWQGKLPAMNFQTHIYSSRPDKRWVRVNDKEYHQGDDIAKGVRLEAIKPQSVVVSFEQQRIEIPALFDWQG